MKHLMWLPVLLALSGCELLGVGVSCTTEIVFGLTVTRMDSVTGGPVIADQVIVATDGAYADTVRVTSDAPNTATPIGIIEDRPGTYRVEIDATGYRTWVRTDIEVTEEGRCHHVNQVHLTARLQPLNSNSN